MSEFQITLPSKGVLYGDKIPDGKMNLRSLTAKEQGILYSPGGEAVVKLNNIISSCIVNSPMDPLDLLITDRMYIMLVLRTRSFGGAYSFPVRCESCRTQFKASANIAEDLKVRNLREGIKEPISFTLPISGDILEYRFLRGKDENQIARNSKRMLLQSVDSSDPSFVMRLATMLVKVNEKDVDYLEAEAFIRTLDAGDTEGFSEDVENNESGVDMTLFVDCRACGYSNELVLPFTAEFFRPRGGKAK